jgi:7,8-dihydroneopterin aldolase/epimerase/oxygenase
MAKLSTLILTDLVFSGVHGSTGRETTDPQHFQIDLEMEIDVSKAGRSDVLADTYDYKNAYEISRTVVEDEHYVLIEKIAMQIAQRICQDPKVFLTKVSLKKLHASENGIPGIVLSYKRAPQEMLAA